MISDESLLLKHAAGGDASALEALMSRYGSRVYRLAHGITRNSADAEEIVQDVFLQMVRKGGAFEGRAALGSWIYRVTTNVALNKRRGKRREVETSLEECLPVWEADGHRSGPRAFLVNHRGEVYAKDLGSGAGRSAAAMTAFGPDRTWTKVAAAAESGGLTDERPLSYK